MPVKTTKTKAKTLATVNTSCTFVAHFTLTQLTKVKITEINHESK